MAKKHLPASAHSEQEDHSFSSLSYDRSSSSKASSPHSAI